VSRRGENRSEGVGMFSLTKEEGGERRSSPSTMGVVPGNLVAFGGRGGSEAEEEKINLRSKGVGRPLVDKEKTTEKKFARGSRPRKECKAKEGWCNRGKRVSRISTFRTRERGGGLTGDKQAEDMN